MFLTKRSRSLTFSFGIRGKFWKRLQKFTRRDSKTRLVRGKERREDLG